jgi:hypothetical protein
MSNSVNDQLMEEATQIVDEVFNKLSWNVKPEVRLYFISKEYNKLMEREA